MILAHAGAHNLIVGVLKIRVQGWMRDMSRRQEEAEGESSPAATTGLVITRQIGWAVCYKADICRT